MPLETVVHGIELFPGKGAQMARSAGASAQILAIEGRYVTLRLRSGEADEYYQTAEQLWGLFLIQSIHQDPLVKPVLNDGWG